MLSRFSCAQLFATLWTVALQTPLSMGFSRQESLSWEDPLEKKMTTHSNILAWEIPQTEELGELESMGLQRTQHSNGLPGLPSWLR